MNRLDQSLAKRFTLCSTRDEIWGKTELTNRHPS